MGVIVTFLFTHVTYFRVTLSVVSVFKTFLLAPDYLIRTTFLLWLSGEAMNPYLALLQE